HLKSCCLTTRDVGIRYADACDVDHIKALGTLRRRCCWNCVGAKRCEERTHMLVKDTMSRAVKTVSPETTIKEAARIMADADLGALPVAAGDHLAGMVTDRDIVVRGVAIGKGLETTVGEVMTHDVLYCHEDEVIGHIAA